MHARPPKHLEERFDWYAPAIAQDPAALKGRWREQRMPAASSLHLDLGCGKGEWTCACAKKHPGELWVGFDNERICIAMSAKKAVVEESIPNVVFALSDGDALEETVGDGEVDVLHLNFSTPCPRTKHAGQRLTHAQRLIAYRRILAPGGRIELKTDSQPFFDWSLHQFAYAGYRISWSTRDLHALVAAGEDSPIDASVISGYEERLVAKGAKVHALVAVPGPVPAQLPQQSCPQSLGDYLPHDLENLGYIPYGMEEYVENVVNRRRNEARKAQRAGGDGTAE
ncbi:MAG: tRNA (guanine(46)-N(7))-methyltransferase TrmB [Coriobacteriales bacterium]